MSATDVRRNLLLEPIEWKEERTATGTWKRFMYPTGEVYEEYTSRRHVGALPLLHFTRGRHPETGRRKVARGFFAVGRLAFGVVAIGHAAMGVVAIGQLGVGLLLGLGQGATGLVALGQLALGAGFGAGQLATGYVAVGQLALGEYVLAQLGLGAHSWTTRGADPEAVRFFRGLAALVLGAASRGP